jgi:GNAT superfamily N-acetyltransferase
MLTGFETGLARTSNVVGDGGSSPDIERMVLRDGSSVVIRPLAAGDEAAIASWFTSWFAGLSAETLYARLFVLLQRLDPRTESALARVDRCEHEAIMAFAPDGVTVGIARCLRVDKPGSAEVSVTVADAWQGQGIASVLLERVAARARSVGIEQLTAICLAGNLTLIRLLSRLGATTVGPSDAGLVDIRIALI